MTINEMLTSSAEQPIDKMVDSQARKVMLGKIVDVVNKRGKVGSGCKFGACARCRFGDGNRQHREDVQEHQHHSEHQFQWC